VIEELLLIGAITFIAAGVGTLTGFGTSTLMVPVLAMFFPLPVTLLFVGIIHFFGDIWKMALFRSGFEWKLVLAFGIPGVVLSWFGAALPLALPAELMERILGGFLLAYVAFLFFHEDWKLPRSMVTAALGGAASGFSAGIFGVGGAIRSTFLSAFDLDKAKFIFTSGAIAFAIDIVRIGRYLHDGTRMDSTLTYGLAAFVPLSLLAAWLAKKVVDRVPQSHFRTVIAVALAIIGIRYLLFPSV
jgi:uncharacterized protein